MNFAKPAAVALLAAVCLAADKPKDDQLPLDPVDAPKVREEAARAAAQAADRAKMAAQQQLREARALQDQILAIQDQKLARIRLDEAQLKLEKAAYIGIGTTPATPDLREQLKIARGMGLLVTQVEAGSPAQAAGVQVHDILEKLNDQLLVNPAQFAALVRSYNPNDEVTLSIIRQNQRQQIKVKLSEKEMPPLDAMGAAFYPNVMVQPFAGNVMENGGVMTVTPRPGRPMLMGPRLMTRTYDNVTGQAGELSVENGHRKLKVTGKDGKVIFDGEIDTPEQRQAIPDEAREMLKRIDAVPMPTGAMPAGVVGRAGGGGWGIAGRPGAMALRREGAELPGRLDAMTLSEDDMTLVLTVKTSPQQGRLLNLVAEDPDGKVLFEGPINTEDEKAAMPKEVRTKLAQPGVASLLDRMRSDGNDGVRGLRAR